MKGFQGVYDTNKMINNKRPLKLTLALMVFCFTRIFTIFPMCLTIFIVWHIRTTINFLYYLFKLFSTNNCWMIIYYMVLWIIKIRNIFYKSFIVNFVNSFKKNYITCIFFIPKHFLNGAFWPLWKPCRRRSFQII